MQELPGGSERLKSGIGFEMMVLCDGSAYERLHPNGPSEESVGVMHDCSKHSRTADEDVGPFNMRNVSGHLVSVARPLSQSPTAAGSNGAGGNG